MKHADHKRAAHGILDALRCGHDIPLGDITAALTLTGDIPAVGEDEASDYTALHCRGATGENDESEDDQ